MTNTTQKTGTVTISERIDGVIFGHLYLSDGNFYDISGENLKDFNQDAKSLADSIGVVIEFWAMDEN